MKAAIAAALGAAVMLAGASPARAEPPGPPTPHPAPGAIALPGSIPRNLWRLAPGAGQLFGKPAAPSSAEAPVIPPRAPETPAIVLPQTKVPVVAPAARPSLPMPQAPHVTPAPAMAAPVPHYPAAGGQLRYFPAHPTLQDRLNRLRGAPAFTSGPPRAAPQPALPARRARGPAARDPLLKPEAPFDLPAGRYRPPPEVPFTVPAPVLPALPQAAHMPRAPQAPHLPPRRRGRPAPLEKGAPCGVPGGMC